MLDVSPTRTATQARQHHDLDSLGDRVATGNRMAFRRLYAFLAMPVWYVAVNELHDHIHAAAVTRSTFVEVWHLAQHHSTNPRLGTGAWIAAITTGRIDDRLRCLNPLSPFLAEHDHHVNRELASMLGAGRATVRVRPRVFASVDDLGHCLSAIASAWLIR